MSKFEEWKEGKIPNYKIDSPDGFVEDLPTSGVWTCGANAAHTYTKQQHKPLIKELMSILESYQELNSVDKWNSVLYNKTVERLREIKQKLEDI